MRLPSFLLGLAMLGLTAALAARRRGRDAAVLSMPVLAGTGLFFVGSGAVLTDPALAAAVTLAMTGFWLGVHGKDRKAVAWRYSFFLALGIGLLAKGPVVLALVGLPVGLWVVLVRSVAHGAVADALGLRDAAHAGDRRALVYSRRASH